MAKGGRRQGARPNSGEEGSKKTKTGRQQRGEPASFKAACQGLQQKEGALRISLRGYDKTLLARKQTVLMDGEVPLRTRTGFFGVVGRVLSYDDVGKKPPSHYKGAGGGTHPVRSHHLRKT